MHAHVGEMELFYILNGRVRVLDNGIEAFLEPGDTLETADGESHCVEAAGDEPLEYIALIIKR